MKRLKRATRVNDVQISSVAMMTVLNVMVLLLRGDAPLWAWIIALLFWPAIAFIANLINPMTDKEYYGE